ncbi:hypothetical protein HYW75_05340 [Candidatus Pacearchaeota archaeon]|nr:hypothetical protein [Candidatus Pacearchaeota archaeon]
MTIETSSALFILIVLINCGSIIEVPTPAAMNPIIFINKVILKISAGTL